jgi:hypothetical protein
MIENRRPSKTDLSESQEICHGMDRFSGVLDGEPGMAVLPYVYRC